MAEQLSTTSMPHLEGGNDASAVLRFDVRARFILAIIVIVQFVLLVGYFIYAAKDFPGSELVLGAEISLTTMVLNFFFGSSSGSVTKSAKGEPGQLEEEVTPKP